MGLLMLCRYRADVDAASTQPDDFAAAVDPPLRVEIELNRCRPFALKNHELTGHSSTHREPTAQVGARPSRSRDL